MLGFAHHDGKIRDLPLGTTILVGLTMMAGGLWFALSEQERYCSWNVDDNPVAGMLYFTGSVLILLRLYTRMDWLGRLPTLDAVISLINSRAMTIYLWGNFAIFLAPYALSYTPLADYDTEDARGLALEYAAAWALIFVAVLLVGWVEDLAAARKPRLLPWNRVKPVKVFSEQPVPATPVEDGARSEPASFVAEGSRSKYGNFVVDAGATNGSKREAGTAVLGERPTELADLGIEDDSPEAVGAPGGRSAAVRANFVIDDVTPEEALALEGVPAGPEDTEFADPDPAPITQHVEEPAPVADDPATGGDPAGASAAGSRTGKGGPGSDPQ
jgi:hypothetical protein